MVGLPVVLLFAMSVKTDGVVLRSGCSADEVGIARLQAGTAVTVKFALSGEDGACYKIAVTNDGKTLEGYVSASALTNTDEFARERVAARSIDLPDTLTAPVKQGGIASGDALKLILENQPGQALMVLERQLRERPRDARLLALAGFAAYRSDDPRRAVEYWRQSLELHPDTKIEEVYKKALNEVEADRSSRRAFGSRFLLRYDDAEVKVDAARAMTAALDEEYARIAAELGCNAAERIAVIVQSPEAYRKTTQAAEWSGGQYDGRIHVALMESGGVGPLTRRVFAHELVHACLADIGEVPLWLNEGLAQRLSGETLAPGARERLKALASGGGLPSLSVLGQSWSKLNGESAGTAYSLSLAAVELIYQYHSGYGIRNLVRNPNMLRQIIPELDRGLGGL